MRGTCTVCGHSGEFDGGCPKCAESAYLLTHIISHSALNKFGIGSRSKPVAPAVRREIEPPKRVPVFGVAGGSTASQYTGGD